MKQEHLEQAWHNAAFLEYLEGNVPSSFYDWKVTVCFYQALHLVRAYLCTQGVTNSPSHDHTLNCISPQPLQQVAKHVPMKGCFYPYRRMYLMSKEARYPGFLRKKGFEQKQLENLADAHKCLETIKAELRQRNFSFEKTASDN